MLHITKSFLDNISVAKKSFLLLLISTFGLLSLGMLTHVGLYNIKEEVYQTYQHNLTTLSSLQKIQHICSTEIPTDIHNFQSQKSDLSHTLLNLQEDALKLDQTFKAIKTNAPEVAKTLTPELEQFNKKVQESIKQLEKKEIETFQNQTLPVLNTLALQCNDLIYQLTEDTLYYVQSTLAQIDEHYYGTIFSTFMMIFIILLLSGTLAYSIYTNIKRLIYGLSDIVAKKTKEYQELALQMEYKVNKEVIKNREKDQIMYQHARLAAMGEMIGNIAHQWRQPLNALTVLIQSFGIKSMSGNLTQEFIDKQVEEGLRLANQMSSTIEDFKNFFSPHKEREYFGVVQALEETLDLVEFFCKDEHIDIQLIAKEEVRVYGYSNEFSQVILNLLNNARDNFKQRDIQKERKIIIKVEKKNRPEPFVMISFMDNGGGIDEHIIDRIFEPYFTTKHKSTGTGIGLYMSKQIIEKQMHGLVTMKNTTSKMGTNKLYKCAQFIIAIPLK